MFSFMKHKDKKDKDEKKKEKKEKKEKEKKEKREPMTQDELNKLDEVKKGVFRRSSDKDKNRKSGYKSAAAGSQDVKRDTSDSSLSGDGPSPSHETSPEPPAQRVSLTRPQRLPSGGRADRSAPPVIAPKPKSILKGKVEQQQVSTNIDDSVVLQENTRMNEYQAHLTNNPSKVEVAQKENRPLEHNTSVSSINSNTPNSPQKSPDKSYKSDLKLPEIVPIKPPKVRELVLQRQPTGGFGFTLRKAVIADNTESGQELKHTVVFAEPGSGPKALQTGLIPGDRLIEINGINVENISREEMVEMIRQSGETVTVKVQPIQELIELSVRPGNDGGSVEVEEAVSKGGTLKRSGSVRYKKGARSETEVQSEKAWLEAEKVWLVHKGGFASASIIKGNGMSPLPEGRVRIKLDHGGDVLEVDEDDVEKANPPQFDRAEDLASLRFLNESSVLHTLRQRYGANLVHTYAGSSVVVVNPMHQMSIYSEKLIQVFKGCKQEDMPPHVYASGQIAYRDMLNSRRDQSIIMMGRSGSGKSVNAKHILSYLTLAAGSVGNIMSGDKLNAVSTLMDAFGNSRSILNTNASRYGQLTTLDFDHSGQIVSASIQVMLFEKTRVVRRPEGEPSFHVFYQMLAGLDSNLRNELQLNALGDPNLFMTPLQRNEDRQRAATSWGKIFHAMDVVGMSEEEKRAICYILAAIYHLGVAGAVKGQNNKPQFARPAAALKASQLMGITQEELARQIFASGGSSTLSRSTSMRGSPADKGQSDFNTNAMEALEGFIIGLYSAVFNAIVSLINRSMSSNMRTSTSITVVDLPGFQNPATCGRNSGATFEDLCYNYANEKIQMLYHELTFTLQQDRYSQENVECDFEFVTSSPAAMVSLIDKPAQQLLVRTSSQEIKDSDKKGLLWILDEEAIFPGATEDSFMDRLFTHHGEQKVKKDSLLRKASSLGNTFILNHYQGTNPVQYNASGWLKGCRENPLIKTAIQVLQDSKRQNINELFNTVKAPVAGMVSGSIVGMEGSTSLKRVGSMRRTFMSGTAGLKKRSMCLQVKFQVDSIIETLRKTKCHFVHCLLPQHNAGLWELKQGTSPQDKPSDENLMNVPLVRSQIRGAELMEGVRIYRQGFPDNMVFSEFRQRFQGLLPPGNQPGKDADMKQAILTILDHLDIDKLNYRVGLSQVFFRAGALNRLEMARDEKITGTIINLQARCRGFLARKNLEKLKVKHIAISCIQKNVRKLMLIKDWSWWKLFTKVQPLLDVHRTEEELKNREYELEQMKAKVEKLEKERNEYKTQAEKLENRLAEVTADLAEEHDTATHASEMLEAETADRMRLDKELKDIQSKYTVLKRHAEKIEMEVTQMHLWQAQAMEGELEDDFGDDSIYKERFEKLLRESTVTRKRMEKNHEEELEKEQSLKKNVERKLHEAIEDAEDQRRQLSAAKKKAQRLVAEMQDTKLHLEEQMSRNNDLERKQRKFDAELSKIQEEVRDEKNLREKLQRERDQLASTKITLEQDLQRMKVEYEEKSEKVDRLNRELMDLTLTGTKGSDQEVMALKKAKHELESKIKDQEEELDDQAGQIQQLEQTKIRLEMNLERSKQQHNKELEEKEEEIEEMRYAMQKKLKNLESQLEEEYDDKKKLQQEKRDLERQIQELSSKAGSINKEGEKRLKRDLIRTRALLRDAEIVIQKNQGTEATKAQIKALRNKLDDSEYTAAAATKAKKTMELEIQDLQQQLDDIFRAKTESENKAMALLREKTELQSQLDENEEDYNDVMRKYKAVVQQATLDQNVISQQLQQIEELTSDRERLKQEIADLHLKVQGFEDNSVDKSTVARLESKIKDLENKLDLEIAQKHRLEVQLSRTKEQVDKLVEEKEGLMTQKTQTEENVKRVQRQLRDLREDFSDAQKKEMEVAQKNKELESKVLDLEGDFEQKHADLKLAFKRISDLQAALEEDMLSDDELMLNSDESDLDDDDDYLGHRNSSLYNNTNSHSRSPRTLSSSSTQGSHSPRPIQINGASGYD
ncbi:unconventional myosin-XVIIIa-like isoform X2 [Saccostrea echinata]|uniref:unconventional myosin-XVIIIa-like isoform X2 n=1 Tax=Saccostrea echinata TaxID=191078 RepID=UPI002A808B63|nr:unconventional myosin-XVIIIa-like isoform X2 [Saccostrea echinata]